jgi:F-type H+-transporting ATPase subunit alpha
MAELTISADEIRSALQQYVSSFRPEVSREEVGIVADAGDGIAHVEGLPSAQANELLEFEDGTLGVSLNLDVREIGVVILGEFGGIEEGQQVKRTGRVSRSRSAITSSAASSTRLANRLTGSARSRPRATQLELQAPNVMNRQAGQGGAAHTASRRSTR